jgi:murein DD-endopeptidase MepM/ murein hydrolase activator NlpD
MLRQLIQGALRILHVERFSGMGVARIALRARAVRRYFTTEEARWRAIVTIGRVNAHVMVLVVLALTAVIAPFTMKAAKPSKELPLPILHGQGQARSPVILPVATQSSANGLVITSASNSAVADDSVIVRTYVAGARPQAEQQRTAFITYTVSAGDTTEAIARQFGLQPSTLAWSNTALEDAPDRLSVGQVLTIPPVDGVFYTVEASDTLSGIAERFKASAEDIVTYPANQLSQSTNIVPGMQLMVPNGVKPVKSFAVRQAASAQSSAPVVSAPVAKPFVQTTGSAFLWPTQGTITQNFWWGHGALDIALATGTPVAASDGGVVTFAGWDNTGYGYMVMLDHGNGFSTLYAHLSQYLVEAGQTVARGQTIAAMGSSGRSTGPHTHFEVRYNGAPQNPMFYLP